MSLLRSILTTVFGVVLLLTVLLMLFFVAAYFWVIFPYRDVWDREMRCFPAAFGLLAVGCTATRYQMQRGPAKPLTLLLVIIPSIWILWHQRVGSLALYTTSR